MSSAKPALMHLFHLRRIPAPAGRVTTLTLGLACQFLVVAANAQTGTPYEELLRDGVASRSARDLPRAARLLQDAVNLSPSDPRGALELAVTHEWSGRLDLAQGVYREYLRLRPDHAGAHLGLARVLRWQRRHEEAPVHYQHSLQSPDATEGMKKEAQLGLIQIDRLDMRLAEARARLDPLLARYPDDSAVRQEDEALSGSVRHTLGLAVGQRTGAAGESTSVSAEWGTRINADVALKVGVARNMLIKPTLPTDAPVNGEQAVSYAEIGSFVPLGRALRARAEYRSIPRQSDEYLLLGEWSDALNPDWRANAGLTVAGPLASASTTASGGFSRSLGNGLNAGLTAFVTSSPSLSNQVTWLARAGWERNGTLAQVFVSRATDQVGYKYTAMLRWPVAPGYQLRFQLGRDAVNDLTSMAFGLDITLGPRNGMTIQRDIAGADRAWTLGTSIALPVPEALPRQ